MSKKRYCITASAYDKRGRCISKATNSYQKSNPTQKHFSILAGMSDQRIYLHSEIACLIKVRGAPVHTLKIERYDLDGKPKLAWPCPSCQLFIKECNVRFVIFTTEEGFKEWIV